MVGSKAGFELRRGARWDPHVPWAGLQMEPAHWGFFLCHPHLHLLCLWMFSLSGRGLEAEIYSSSLYFHLPCLLNFFHGPSSPSYELQSPEELVPDFQIYQGLGNRLCKWPSDEHATVSHASSVSSWCECSSSVCDNTHILGVHPCHLAILPTVAILRYWYNLKYIQVQNYYVFQMNHLTH